MGHSDVMEATYPQPVSSSQVNESPWRKCKHKETGSNLAKPGQGSSVLGHRPPRCIPERARWEARHTEPGRSCPSLAKPLCQQTRTARQDSTADTTTITRPSQSQKIATRVTSVFKLTESESSLCRRLTFAPAGRFAHDESHHLGASRSKAKEHRQLLEGDDQRLADPSGHEVPRSPRTKPSSWRARE